MTTQEEKGEPSAFKKAQLRYRRRGDAPDYNGDLEELIDFCNSNDDDRIIPLSLPCSYTDNLYTGPIFGLQSFPGFFHAPQALSPQIQDELAFRAVSEFCEPPHATNIDLVAPKASEENNMNDSMWKVWKVEHKFAETNGTTQVANVLSNRNKYRCFKKLAWATMGYQYDWTSRSYHDGSKSDMPLILQLVTEKFARTSLLLQGSSKLKFTASASIVNFYHNKSLMGGHRDDLEEALDKPIVSLSLGCPAIFLLGGKTKEETPVVPILVRPGDVMVLGGDCRLAYHGMARVIPSCVVLPRIPESFNSLTPFQVTNNCADQSSQISELDRHALALFLSLHRININVRQVYPD